MEIRRLTKGDDRSGFRCGVKALDDFFHRYAKQNQFRHQIGATWVGLEEGRIVAYATVAPCSVNLPESHRGRLPQYPQLPALRMARLAVDEDFKGRGLGTTMLRHCGELALAMADDLGCVGLVVDAKPTAVDFYAQYGLFTIEEGADGAAVMFLSTKQIRAALRAGT